MRHIAITATAAVAVIAVQVLAKPAKLPDQVLAAKVLENYLNASHKDDYGFSDLTAVTSSQTYTSPSCIVLNANYINFLRRVLPAGSVCFRMAGELQPVVILADGRAVGVLMPAKQ